MTGFTPEEWRIAARIARHSIFTEGNPDLADAWEKAAVQAEARLIPDGGMALTAEQVEDVRTVAWYTGAGLSRAPMAEIHRLRALFPATEPAEEVKPIGWYRTMTPKFATAHFGFPDVDGSLSFRRLRTHTATDGGKWVRDGGDWELSEYPPAPAEPAEEETKAERWTVSTTYRAAGPSETSDDKVRIDRFADAWRASGYEVTVTPVAEGEERTCTQCPDYAHGGDGCDLDPSPVVPAPTETEWATVKSDGQQQNPMQGDVGNDKI